MKNQRIWLKRTIWMIFVLLLTFTAGVGAASPKLNKTKLTLNVGESYILKVNNYTGSSAIRWKSTDNVKATVSQTGRVVARKAGKVKISAVIGKKSYSCALTIQQPVKAISLNKEEMKLTAGESEKLTSKILPSTATNKKIRWSSDNTKVATVTSSGKVKAVKAGSALITATAKDGSGVAAVCKVTVAKKQQIMVQNIKLDRTSLNMVDGEWDKLIATVTPENAKKKKVTWKSSNEKVARATASGRVKAVDPGTAVITASAKDGSGVTAVCTVTVIPKEGDRYKDGNVDISGVKQMGQSVNASKFLACLQKMSEQVSKDYKKGRTWIYGETQNRLWEKEVAKVAAGGVGSVVCSEIVRYALVDAGIFTQKMHMYAQTNGKFKFSSKVQSDPAFNKKYKVITVNKTARQLLKEGNLLPGDICGWSGVWHTNIYAGNNKWYDAGRGCHTVYKNGKYYFTSFGPSANWGMDRKIVQIVRLR